jgi:site-specific DNA-cytosine methylase
MKVLIACEFSGVVRDAFRAKGHEAFSCDLLASEGSQDYHIQYDCREVAYLNPWDLMIAHPPCTALAVSGNAHYADSEERRKALEFIEILMLAPIEKICIENPVGVISSAIRKPDQYIQPYEFGDDASKKTCLWLKNLPPLDIDPLARRPGRKVVWKGKVVERWANQTDSGQNKLGPSPDRGKLRSITYQGIADAMANQWG